MKYNKRPIFLLAFITFLHPAHLNAEIIDRAVSVIGDEAITLSDVEKAGSVALRQTPRSFNSRTIR